MKKVTALIITMLVLVAMIIGGCSSQTTSSNSTDNTAKKTLGPTAVVSDSTIEEDTMYDEENFSIVIPKDWTLDKTKESYTWMLKKGNYAVSVIIVDFRSTLLDTSIITGSQESFDAFVTSFEEGANNQIKMDATYQKVTVDGKTAVLLTGKPTSYNGAVKVYLIESNSSFIDITFIEMQSSNDESIQNEMDKIANGVYDTIKIK